MKITELQAYKRLEEMFERKGYSQGIKDVMPIYRWDNVRCIPDNLIPGHYVNARKYGKIKLRDIPEKYLVSKIIIRDIFVKRILLLNPRMM